MGRREQDAPAQYKVTVLLRKDQYEWLRGREDLNVSGLFRSLLDQYIQAVARNPGGTFRIIGGT